MLFLTSRRLGDATFCPELYVMVPEIQRQIAFSRVVFYFINNYIHAMITTLFHFRSRPSLIIGSRTNLMMPELCDVSASFIMSIMQML